MCCGRAFQGCNRLSPWSVKRKLLLRLLELRENQSAAKAGATRGASLNRIADKNNSCKFLYKSLVVTSHVKLRIFPSTNTKIKCLTQNFPQREISRLNWLETAEKLIKDSNMREIVSFYFHQNSYWYTNRLEIQILVMLQESLQNC